MFGLHNRTAAYRFVTLVDVYLTSPLLSTLNYQESFFSDKNCLQVMYETKARLLCTAEGSPLELLESIVTIADAQQIAPRTSSRSRKSDDIDLCVDNELGFAKDRTISRYDLAIAAFTLFYSFEFD